MLGKLFSAASTLTPTRGSPNASRPNSSLDSVQEDIHTRNLLFPDADILYQHQHDQMYPMTSTVPMLTSAMSTFDVKPDVDLELRDVRVVLMQEATSSFNSAALMYDSHPLQESTPTSPISINTATPRGSRGVSMSSPRRTSIGQTSKPVVITQDAPRSFGAFDRRPSTHARQANSYVETEVQRSSREYKEEVNTIANCMFGASDVMAYKGTGSKVHILPTESRSSPFPLDGHGSLGRSSMRSSRLAQSFTSESVSTTTTSTAGHSRLSDRKRVLVTRIFPVPLPNDNDDDSPTTFEGSSYPFPKLDEKEKKPQPKQKRTPMYAIGLVIQLPASQNTSAPRSAYRGAGSYMENESISSSFNSLKPSWSVLGSGFGVESLESSFSSDVDDRIDMVTQHWDIIIRTLDHLQAVASANIVAMLKQVDIASPDPMGVGRAPHHTRTASISVAGKRVEENIKPAKPIRTNIKTIQLMPYALANDPRLRAEIDFARQRIVGGIKSLPVVTRQGRWGIWRDEARWVGKWAGGKEEGFFFYNLLTAFLGTHTEWLEAIGPTWYRRQNYRQQRASGDDEIPIKARTIIVSNDKMAARRLIFLLSAFLPNNQQPQVPFVRQSRPGVSASFGGLSQSPPSYVPLNLREQSLRRKVNKLKVKGARTMSFPAQPAPILLANQVKEQHHRSASDAPAPPAGNLSVPSTYTGRTNSTATTSTTTPVATIPHFSTRRPTRGTGPAPRPGSSGSLAADDLIRSLKRGDSNASSDTHSRWGSVLGSFWSGKRRDSTTLTDTTTISADDLAGDGGKSLKTRGKLAEMVEEAQRHREAELDQDKPALEDAPELTSTTAPQPVKAPAHAIHPSGAYESPVKTSINEDGVIDIDVPLPDFLRGGSFGSAISSPSSSGILSSPGITPELEGFEHYTRSGHDDGGMINVGGWLPQYHPDFVLQAIPAPTADSKPATSLEDQVRASMAAEPTPAILLHSIRSDEEERWVTVSTAIIADTTSFTIKRIYLRRLVKLQPSPSEASPPSSAPNSYDGKTSLYGNPYGAAQAAAASTYTPATSGGGGGGCGAGRVLREEWGEEMCISFDAALIDAVEKIMAHTGPAAPQQPGATTPRSPHRSRTSSRSESKIRTVVPAPAPAPMPVPVPVSDKAGRDAAGEDAGGEEVPRGEVKKILLEALGEIAREVAESRVRGEEGPGGNDEEAVEEGLESFLREGVREWFVGVEEG